MDLNRFEKVSDTEWHIPATGAMRVPAVLYAEAPLVEDMDEKVYEQLGNVATLPGIVQAAYAMPDAHWGYGFPIGGVAAFDEDEGVVSPGGVGYDINCGVRLLRTPLTVEEGSAYAYRYPRFTVVRPAHNTGIPASYAVPKGDIEMMEFVSNWIELKRMDGTIDSLYAYWMLGGAAESREPRWSIIRNVLGWVD